MGFSTTPITVEQAKKLIAETDGEVVSASTLKDMTDMDWFSRIAKAAIQDDGITVFLTLDNDDFVEYCTVKDIY